MAEISDKVYWTYLKANKGLYSQTAAAIAQHENIKMSRQAVRERAIRNPDKLNEVFEYLKDKAESNMHNLMDDADSDAVKLKANLEWLNRKAKDRGWGEDETIDINANISNESKISLENVDPEILLKIKQQQKNNKYSDEIKE